MPFFSNFPRDRRNKEKVPNIRSLTCVLRRGHIINMVGVRDKTCARAECSRYPSYGLKGSNKREFCSQHAEPGMVNVYHRTCIHEGCLKRPSFGIKGTKRKDYCEAHSESGMVNLNIRCSRQGCNRMARYGADEKLCYRHVRNMASRRGKYACGLSRAVQLLEGGEGITRFHRRVKQGDDTNTPPKQGMIL